MQHAIRYLFILGDPKPMKYADSALLLFLPLTFNYLKIVQLSCLTYYFDIFICQRLNENERLYHLTQN